MAKEGGIALGLDFGTESVRALLVDLDGNELGSAVVRYQHGQITETLARRQQAAAARLRLAAPAGLDRQFRPGGATRREAGGARGQQVIGIGVDFTSCTMLPTLRRRHAAVPGAKV